MEALKSMFQAKSDFVSGAVEAGNPPSDEQLGTFLRNLTTETGRAIRNVHPSVQEALRESFAEVGWDVKQNCGTREEPPSVEELSAFLSSTLETLASFEPSVDPSDEELDDLSMACDRLWSLDGNRLTPEVEYSINLQEGKKPYSPGDLAPDPLFNYVRDEVFQRPTYAAFYSLLDNYESAVGTAESFSAEEQSETNTFISLVAATPCMRYAHKYLVAKGKAPEDDHEFKCLLFNVWFAMYGRSRGAADSSGFEHVFVGESSRGKITGLHNWIQVYSEEKKGNLDYRGYILPRHRGGYDSEPHETEQMVTIQFEWGGELKDISSTLVGVSPEFELALYTMLFLLDQEKTVAKLGPYNAEITTYIFRQSGKCYIGSAFPGEAPC